MESHISQLKQSFSFRSLRLMEQKDALLSDLKSFSDSELSKKDDSSKKIKRMGAKIRSESCLLVVNNQPSLVEKIHKLSEEHCKKDEAKQDDTSHLPQSPASDPNDTENINFMSVSSILRGSLNQLFDSPKTSQPKVAKSKPNTDEIYKTPDNPETSSKNPILENSITKEALSENIFGQPRCLALKNRGSDVNPFLVDDSLLFEPDFEVDDRQLESRTNRRIKQDQKLKDNTNDMFFDDDEITPGTKYSAVDREEGELSPDLHADKIKEPGTSLNSNADFFKNINECLRELDKKCRDIYTTSVPIHSVKHLKSTLSKVDNIKKKLSFLLNSTSTDTRRKGAFETSSDIYSNWKNKSKGRFDQITNYLMKHDRAHSTAKSSPFTKDSRTWDYKNESKYSDSEFTARENGKENDSRTVDESAESHRRKHGERERNHSRESRSRHRRRSRQRPTQKDLLDRKKINILEKLGTKKEIQRVQSLFKRQMNLITQYVIPKRKSYGGPVFTPREPDRNRKRHSSQKQGERSTGNVQGKINLSDLKTLDDMEAFLNTLKEGATDKLMCEQYIKEDKMKGVLKFTSKKEKKPRAHEEEAVVGQVNSGSKATLNTDLNTNILKQPLDKDTLAVSNDNEKSKLTESANEKVRDVEHEIKEKLKTVDKNYSLYENDDRLEKNTSNIMKTNSNSILTIDNKSNDQRISEIAPKTKEIQVEKKVSNDCLMEEILSLDRNISECSPKKTREDIVSSKRNKRDSYIEKEIEETYLNENKSDSTPEKTKRIVSSKKKRKGRSIEKSDEEIVSSKRHRNDRSIEKSDEETASLKRYRNDCSIEKKEKENLSRNKNRNHYSIDKNEEEIVSLKHNKNVSSVERTEREVICTKRNRNNLSPEKTVDETINSERNSNDGSVKYTGAENIASKIINRYSVSPENNTKETASSKRIIDDNAIIRTEPETRFSKRTSRDYSISPDKIVKETTSSKGNIRDRSLRQTEPETVTSKTIRHDCSIYPEKIRKEIASSKSNIGDRSVRRTEPEIVTSKRIRHECPISPEKMEKETTSSKRNVSDCSPTRTEPEIITSKRKSNDCYISPENIRRGTISSKRNLSDHSFKIIEPETETSKRTRNDRSISPESIGKETAPSKRNTNDRPQTRTTPETVSSKRIRNKNIPEKNVEKNVSSKGNRSDSSVEKTVLALTKQNLKKVEQLHRSKTEDFNDVSRMRQKEIKKRKTKNQKEDSDSESMESEKERHNHPIAKTLTSARRRAEKLPSSERENKKTIRHEHEGKQDNEKAFEGTSQSLMTDLLGKNVFMLNDKNLAALNNQFCIKVVGNEVYLKKLSSSRRRKHHSRRVSKTRELKPSHRRPLGNRERSCEGPKCKPIDPDTVNTSLEEMENFLEQLRSNKKISDDEQYEMDRSSSQTREDKFLSRIQAKRKAKLMACVSGAPNTTEKEAKFLKALEKRSKKLSDSSDTEGPRQKLMEKIRAETDAIVLARNRPAKPSAPNTEDDSLMDVKAILNLLKEAECADDDNSKQASVSFQLKRAEMNRLENLSGDKASSLSEESQKFLNSVRAKMRAKKTPTSNISHLMKKPEE